MHKTLRSSSAKSVPYIKNRVIKISPSSRSIWNEVILLVYEEAHVPINFELPKKSIFISFIAAMYYYIY